MMSCKPFRRPLPALLLVAVLVPIVYLSGAPDISVVHARSAAEQHASRHAAAAKHHVILIRQVTFEPKVLIVGVGDSIEWQNKDIVAHTATSDRKGFDSAIIPPGATWSFVAKKRGTYSYTCTLHPNMKGKLVVRERSARDVQ